MRDGQEKHHVRRKHAVARHDPHQRFNHEHDSSSTRRPRRTDLRQGPREHDRSRDADVVHRRRQGRARVRRHRDRRARPQLDLRGDGVPPLEHQAPDAGRAQRAQERAAGRVRDPRRDLRHDQVVPEGRRADARPSHAGLRARAARCRGDLERDDARRHRERQAPGAAPRRQDADPDRELRPSPLGQGVRPPEQVVRHRHQLPLDAQRREADRGDVPRSRHLPHPARGSRPQCVDLRRPRHDRHAVRHVQRDDDRRRHPQGSAPRRRQRGSHDHARRDRLDGQRRAVHQGQARAQGTHHGLRSPRLQGVRPARDLPQDVRQADRDRHGQPQALRDEPEDRGHRPRREGRQGNLPERRLLQRDDLPLPRHQDRPLHLHVRDEPHVGLGRPLHRAAPGQPSYPPAGEVQRAA